MPSDRTRWSAGARVWLCAATALIAFSSPAAPRAQGKRAMTLVDLVNIPRVLDPQVAGDGRRVIFTMLTSDWASGRRTGQIWQVQGDGTGLKKMTAIESGAVNARWAPDGNSFAFLARGDSGDQSIYLLSADGGAPRQISHHAGGVSDIAWSGDGASVYFLSGDPRTPQEVERDRARDDVFAFDENFKQQHLWRLSVSDGSEQRLTGGELEWFERYATNRQYSWEAAPTANDTSMLP